jgi:hypothetical protein
LASERYGEPLRAVLFTFERSTSIRFGGPLLVLYSVDSTSNFTSHLRSDAHAIPSTIPRRTVPLVPPRCDLLLTGLYNSYHVNLHAGASRDCAYSMLDEVAVMIGIPPCSPHAFDSKQRFQCISSRSSKISSSVAHQCCEYRQRQSMNIKCNCHSPDSFS